MILTLLMLVSIQRCSSFYPGVIGPRETAGLRSDRSATTGWRSGLISSQFSSSRLSHLPSISHRTKQSKPLSSTVVMAGNILDDIITRKKAEVEAMKANPPPAVSEWVQKMGTIKPKNAFLRAIKKPKGTTAIITQIKAKTPAVERLCSVVDPAVNHLSTICYEQWFFHQNRADINTVGFAGNALCKRSAPGARRPSLRGRRLRHRRLH
jgi:hypothetical protein